VFLKMSENKIKINLDIPQSIYQNLQTVAFEKKKTVPEFAFDLLCDCLKKEITKRHKEKLADYLENLGDE
jgi:hypothetical protein